VLQGVTRVAEIVRRNETLTPEQLRALDREPVNWAPFVFVPFWDCSWSPAWACSGPACATPIASSLIFGSVFGGPAAAHFPWSLACGAFLIP
jgi:hypothetical protein